MGRRFASVGQSGRGALTHVFEYIVEGISSLLRVFTYLWMFTAGVAKFFWTSLLDTVTGIATSYVCGSGAFDPAAPFLVKCPPVLLVCLSPPRGPYVMLMSRRICSHLWREYLNSGHEAKMKSSATLSREVSADTKPLLVVFSPFLPPPRVINMIADMWITLFDSIVSLCDKVCELLFHERAQIRSVRTE